MNAWRVHQKVIKAIKKKKEGVDLQDPKFQAVKTVSFWLLSFPIH